MWGLIEVKAIMRLEDFFDFTFVTIILYAYIFINFKIWILHGLFFASFTLNTES